MCYKADFPSSENIREKAETNITIEEDFKEQKEVSGFSMPDIPISIHTKPNSIIKGKWKLIPNWVNNYNEAKQYANTLNARAEDIFDKTSYKGLIQSNRCLVWINGFYENQHPDNYTTNEYFINHISGLPFTLGGIYNQWIDKETGELYNTCSIVTTPANTLMSEIHNTQQRMPLIIESSVRQDWLGNLTREEITYLMQPLKDGRLTARITSSKTKKRKNNPLQGELF